MLQSVVILHNFYLKEFIKKLPFHNNSSLDLYFFGPNLKLATLIIRIPYQQPFTQSPAIHNPLWLVETP